MELPVLGHVSLPDIIFGVILLLGFLMGCARGFGGELKGLVAMLVAAAVAFQPSAHQKVAGFLSNAFPSHAGAIAYLAVFFVVWWGLGFLGGRLPVGGLLNTGGIGGALLGGLAGLLKAVLVITLCLIILYDWQLPWQALYDRSKIASFIINIWRGLSLLPDLFSTGRIGLPVNLPS